MKFFYAGRLGHTILNLLADDLWMIVRHSPAHDPWLHGESLTEIIKRIAHLEMRAFSDVLSEARHIRFHKDNS